MTLAPHASAGENLVQLGMRDACGGFLADEEWKEIKRVTGAQHGDLVGEIEDRMLVLTSYSLSVLPSKQQ